MSTRVDPKRAAEGEGFRRARYEIVTRHALALDGVLAAEVHLADHLAGPVRLVAQSLTASLQAPRSHRSRRPMAFDSSQYASAFFPAVLAKAGLHTYVATPAIDEDTRAPAPNGRVTHLVAERIDPLGQV